MVQKNGSRLEVITAKGRLRVYEQDRLDPVAPMVESTQHPRCLGTLRPPYQPGGVVIEVLVDKVEVVLRGELAGRISSTDSFS
jgi:hypothetical protein